MPRAPKDTKRANAAAGRRAAAGAGVPAHTVDGKSRAAVELGRRGGLARARALSRAKRSAIAKKAAAARWAR
jgi:hypothetical protein